MPDTELPAGLRLFEARRAKMCLAALLGIYAAAFLVFYPQGITVADEGAYMRQAQAIVAGSSMIQQIDPVTGESKAFRPNDKYPLGTALMMAPLFALGGQPAAFLLSLICLLGAVLLTARWLEEQGHSPLWAILILSYPPTIVIGRLAMSESLSLLLGVLGLWLFWRGIRGAGHGWLAAGFVAGASILVREGNVLLFAPLFAGAVVRRDARWPMLVVGGLLGIGLRLLVSWISYGDPFFAKAPDTFSLSAALDVAPLYLFCLLVLVPGGLASVAMYRGERRAEVIATIAIFVMFYFLYAYSGQTSGFVKRLILGPRYFIPILPLLALTSAEVWPRLGAAAVERFRSRRAAIERIAGVAVASSIAVLGVALVGVQWAHAEWLGDQTKMRTLILEHTQPGTMVVTNWRATSKFIDLANDERTILRRDHMNSETINQLLDQQGSFVLILLDRSDSNYWVQDAFHNATFLRTLRHSRSVLADVQITDTDHMRIWEVRR